jgi:hypothetical protein
MRIRCSAAFFGCLAGLAIQLAAQTAVEYGTITAAGAAGSAGAMKDTSKSIGNVLGNLGKTLDKGEASPPSGESVKVAPAKQAKAAPSRARTAAPPAPRPIQPDSIRKGMTRADLLAKLGKPFMKTGGMDGVEFIETYCYQGPEDLITVTIRDGTVTSISPEPEYQTAPAGAGGPAGKANDVTPPQSSP